MSGTESTEENIDELKEAKEVDEDSDMAEGGNTSFSGKNMEAHKSRDPNGKPPSSRQSTLMDKKTQQMLAELYRLKAQMSETQHSIHRPPIRPYTPNIFNSLSPYYNQYMVNYTIQDLQQGIPVTRGYHHRSTALGVVDPEISWRMDTFPAPFHQSRQLSKLFHSITWSRNMQQSEVQGSTRLPPLPMPGFPKFNKPSYQPHQMTYDQLASFRGDLRSVHGRLAEQQAKTDYERTVQDWKRMNLSELKKLPPDRRHHVKKAIMSYMGTSRGSSRALKPLAKELETTTTETVMQQ